MSNQIQNLPVHVAITMDGNGRWATNQNLPRTAGHNEGLKVAKRIVKAASDMGIKYLTLYVFFYRKLEACSGRSWFFNEFDSRSFKR